MSSELKLLRKNREKISIERRDGSHHSPRWYARLGRVMNDERGEKKWTNIDIEYVAAAAVLHSFNLPFAFSCVIYRLPRLCWSFSHTHNRRNVESSRWVQANAFVTRLYLQEVNVTSLNAGMIDFFAAKMKLAYSRELSSITQVTRLESLSTTNQQFGEIYNTIRPITGLSRCNSSAIDNCMMCDI